MRRSLLLPLFLFLLTTATAAHADEFKTADNASAEEVVTGMSDKMVRGVANVATGWLEFPKQIYVTFREDGVAAGLFSGPVRGIGMTVARTVSGVVELSTFYLPVPGFYDPLLTPAYVWKKY